MQDFNMTYETSGTANYLCTETSEKINAYQMNMMQNNTIQGLLPVHASKLNGKYVLKYDITRMRRLKNVLEDGSLIGDAAKSLLYHILFYMTETEQYFLTYSQCLLNVEYMYLDEKNEVKFVYLPFGEQQITTTEDVRMFYQTLLTRYLTREKEVYADLLYYIVGQDFSLAGLLQHLEEGVGGKRQEIRQKNDYAESSAKKIPMKEPEEPKQAPVKEPIAEKPKPAPSGMESRISGNGSFAIPEIPAKKNEKQPTKPPKKEKNGGIFGNKHKEKNVAAATSAPAPEQAKAREAGGTAGSASGRWKETQLPVPEKKNEVTQIMDVDRGPVLKYQGGEMVVSKFPFSIGRQGSNVDFTIPSQKISRLHATLLEKDGKYYIRDENSGNHTYVNGMIIAPFTEVEIGSGTKLRLANEEMIFEE